VRVARADGAKCERCWNYSIHVGENAAYPTICERCTAALAEIARDPARVAEGVAPEAKS
jgi:isoleucyl-tRNA synthetase